LQEAIRLRQTARALELIAAGYPIQAHNPEGVTALHWAAEKGLVSIVEALIAAGVDVNAADVCGHTALSRAVCGGHWGVITKLLAHGADIHLREKFVGGTLLTQRR
jgi:ankyrin repeat protein